MANNTYKIEYASLGRAVCKLAACKKKIEKGELRVGKTYPNDRFTEGGTMTDWYHAPCVFQHLKRARKTTKKIDSEDDLEGYSHLHDNDQKKLSEYIQGTLLLTFLWCVRCVRRVRLIDGAGAAFAAGEDIENPYLGGGDGGSGGEEKKTPAKKKAKAKAPEPVIPAHLLNRSKNKKPKRTEKKNVEVELFRARILKEGTKTPKYLPMDSQPLVLGRGDETGITDKRCSRTQLELVASQADKTVTLTMLGNNPTSFVFDEEGEPQPLTKGQQVDLPNGSRFILFVDDVYVVQTRTDKVMQEVEVEVADEDDEATDEDEELQRQAAEAAASKKRKAPAAAVPKAGGGPAAKKAKAEPKPKAPPKKKAKKKGGGGGIDLDGTIDSDDDGQPNEYDYDDGFLVRNDASLGEEEGAYDDDDEGFQRTKRRGSARHDDDDAEALREARQYLQGFDDGDEGESKQAYKNGKPVCRYGATCYRVNPDHRKQFWHPSKAEAGDHALQSKGKTQQTTPGRKPAPTPMTAGRGGDDDDDAISEEEDGAAKQSDKDRDAAGKVKTLSAMSAFRELDPGIIRDVLEANNGSLHLTMEALKSLTAEDL